MKGTLQVSKSEEGYAVIEWHVVAEGYAVSEPQHVDGVLLCASVPHQCQYCIRMPPPLAEKEALLL